MRSYIILDNKKEELPDRFKEDDVRYPDELVEVLLSEFSEDNDIIFDPFSGYGTTLIVAERNNRVAYGIEYLKDRVDYTRSHMKYPDRLIHGDATKINDYDLPCFDLSITSPPYMCKEDKENPFTSYTTEGDGYDAYLDDIKHIYSCMRNLMKENAHIIIEVSNIKGDSSVTTLAWDICKKLEDIFSFKGEIIINWDEYGYGYEHSYCLVFTK